MSIEGRPGDYIPHLKTIDNRGSVHQRKSLSRHFMLRAGQNRAPFSPFEQLSLVVPLDDCSFSILLRWMAVQNSYNTFAFRHARITCCTHSCTSSEVLIGWPNSFKKPPSLRDFPTSESGGLCPTVTASSHYFYHFSCDQPSAPLWMPSRKKCLINITHIYLRRPAFQSALRCSHS